ncbi:MAG: DNA alkylation repair protein [Candidatus Rhabdochlamydia sp.]
MQENLKRKGAVCRKQIPAQVLESLNQGKIESGSLTELLAIDLPSLLQATFPQMSLQSMQSVKDAAHLGWMKRVKLIGSVLHEEYGEKVLDRLMHHPSDSVRGWAAGVISFIPDLSLEERLRRVKPLAQDLHFGVREMAWLFLRDHIAQEIVEAVQILEPWVHDDNHFIRRFAVESTRPRGVWCAHIPLLKENPSLGLALLEPLKQDSKRYVQDSVANWLNDAGKTDKQFVLDLTQRWLATCQIPATAYICKRAQRNVIKPSKLT